MRRYALFAVLLAACTPAPPAQAPAETGNDDTGVFAAFLDEARVADGQWSYRGDEGVVSACFS